MSKILGMAKKDALHIVEQRLMANWALNDYDPLAEEVVEREAKQIAGKTYNSERDLPSWHLYAEESFTEWFAPHRRYYTDCADARAARALIARLFLRNEPGFSVFVEHDCIFDAVHQSDVPGQNLTEWIDSAEKAYDKMGEPE